MTSSITQPVAKAVRSALSRGPGYEETPVGSAFEVDSVRGYPLDFTAKTTSPMTRDRDRLQPITLAQLALGWWERHLAGEPAALEEFFDACGRMEALGELRDGELLWPVDHGVAKYRLHAGFCSALTQAEAASVLVRAHLAAGEDAYAQRALQAVAPMLRERSAELVTYTSVGPVYEESPGPPSSHVLNGWISALWGVLEVAIVTGDARARRSYEDSLAALRALLPSYDTGWWSLYSVYPHPLEDLAKPFYHRLHVAQLTAMHRLTGLGEFGITARRWEGYDRPLAAAAVVGHKALFALLDGRRRRRWLRDR